MIIYCMDILATFVFALSGAFRAVKHELDLLGLLVLATATGVGGGIIRDIVCGDTPPMAFKNETYLLVCFLAGFLVFLIAPWIARRWNVVMIADAIGLGLFSAIGAQKAMSLGLGPLGVMFSGAVTATGGGIIRDILVRRIPDVIHEDFYATAAIAGGAVFYFAAWCGLSDLQAFAVSLLFTVSLRVIAMYAGFKLPKVRRLPASPSTLTRNRKKPRGKNTPGESQSG
ncbi:MAG: trimeric intracellular cation channel family protein [Syntrophaceae bacterium]